MSGAALAIDGSAALQRRIDDLELENSELRAALKPERLALPPGLYLTPAERRLLEVLVRRESANHRMLCLALWGGRHYLDRDPKNVAVQIYKLRRKIAPVGGRIENRWAQGYALDAASRRRFAAGAP